MTDRLTDEELANYDRPAQRELDTMNGGTVTVLVHHWLAVSAELRARRARDLIHAQNSCLDCEGPLVQCDCQPDCPGGKCARRCWERPANTTERPLTRWNGTTRVPRRAPHCSVCGAADHNKRRHAILDRLTKEQP